MVKLIIYSLEVAVSLALFYTAFWLFLRNETFFKLNRIYLVFSVILSLLVPLLNISVGGDSFVGKYLISPIHDYEKSLFEKNEASVKNNSDISEGANKMTNPKPADPYHTRETESVPSTELTALPVKGIYIQQGINWLSVAIVIYFIGALFFLIRFVANFIWIFTFVQKHKPQDINGMKVVRAENDISPFSFLNFIFIGQKDYPYDELSRIISHEKVHIRQKHTVDLILFELLLIFQWFNPFVWLYKRAIKINHEYLADEGTINSGIDLPSYQYSLLNQVLAENNFEISSSYSMSVKKRIAMMLQRRSSKLSVLKVALVLPVFLFLISAFGFNSEIAPPVQTVTAALPRDSSIKEVPVTVEYLKLLEGEYIATKGPWRERSIIFTELLGYLYGFDAGYNYKIIPVGGESFVNPDDKASLVFDSKDKKAISLLLFNKIKLTRQYSEKASNLPKRSMGFTLANVMLKRGIPAGLKFYKAAKDSSNYVTTEGQINYAGYVLLQAGKLKESAALFKLNTELFPQSFNTYDSYGESLLSLGDKVQAIENYKKSLALNPGSVSGLTHLKDLGVNTDDLVKTIPISAAEVKLIEGDYLSTNEPNWVRWIRIKMVDGTLYGHDNGYRYKLIHMGNGKFINPDDGASLVFNTADHDRITLSLFGKINLKKVKTVTESEVDLTKYAGNYLPAKGDTIQKPAEIVIRDNKMYRVIPSDPEGPNKTIELKMVTEHEFFYTDNSGRSLEFIVKDKNQVIAVVLRRFEGRYKLIKQ